MICRPVTKNYKRGYASVTKEERQALRDGSIVSVRVVDREGGPDTELLPTLVLEQIKWHSYRKKNSRYVMNILRFNFIQVRKLQGEAEDVTVSL